MKEITAVGIDLAKSVFQIHAVDRREKLVLKKKVSRSRMVTLIRHLPRCRIYMEACGSAHYWARVCQEEGHEAFLIAGKYVKKFVKNNKDDAIDAEAIVTCGLRPNTLFVPIKTPRQLELQALHRVRSRLVAERTAKINEMRGFLYEHGFVIPKGIHKARTEIGDFLKGDELSPLLREIIQDLFTQYLEIDKRVTAYESLIKREMKPLEVFERLQEVPGVGYLTASAIIIDGMPENMKNGRQFAAYLGLVPRHSGSGGKNTNHGMSKRGDAYIRTLLIHGARSILRLTPKRKDKLSAWCEAVKKRQGYNRAAVALANKNARIIWRILTEKTRFNLDLAA